MFLTKSMDQKAEETAREMHQRGVTDETPVKDCMAGFFVGTIPFRQVEAIDGRRVIPLNRYDIEGTTYYLYQRMD